MLYTVPFTGPFGFIKPWTAVRDGETRSQQFLTPSIVEGMRQKLEVSAIVRHRLQYGGISEQQEQTQPRAWQKQRPYAVIVRGVMLSPVLWLAFPTPEDAELARTQHLCLCRNEDLVYPQGEVRQISPEAFDRIPGIELLFGPGEDAFCVGFNRFAQGEPMFGSLHIVGNPLVSNGLSDEAAGDFV
jgi:hypothetical protein